MAQKGANCVLTAPGYGSRRVRATRLGYSIEVVSDESVARYGKAFYPKGRVASMFTLSVTFGDSDTEYRSFGNWMQGFGRRSSDPNSPVKFMHVLYPARNFAKQGFYKRGVTFGDNVGPPQLTMDLMFIGAHSPGEYTNEMVSQYRGSWRSRFYPGGYQASGPSRASEALFSNINNFVDTVTPAIREDSRPPARGDRSFLDRLG